MILKRVRENVVTPESQTFVKGDTQSTSASLEEYLAEIHKWLGSLENGQEDYTTPTWNLTSFFSRSQTRRTRTRVSEMWNYRLHSAKLSAELLQDSINVSRCIDTVSIRSGRSFWVEDQARALSHHHSSLSIHTITSDLSDHGSELLNQPITEPIGAESTSRPRREPSKETICVEPSRGVGPVSSVSNLEAVGLGAWCEEDSRKFLLPKSRTRPTLDEYFPTSTFRIPPRKSAPLTIASSLIAEPRVRHFFRLWNLPDHQRHESYQQQYLDGTCGWILNTPSSVPGEILNQANTHTYFV